MIYSDFSTDGLSGEIVLRPNISASWRCNVFLLFVIAAIQLFIGVMFASLGAWPVLPFAGLEVLVLSLVIYSWYRRYTEQEVLRFEPGYLHLQRGQTFPRCDWRYERFWIQVCVVKSGESIPRVVVKYRDKHIEVGRFLNEREKHQLIQCLRHFVTLH